MKGRPWFALVALLAVAFLTWLIFAPRPNRDVTPAPVMDTSPQVADKPSNAPPTVPDPLPPEPAPEILPLQPVPVTRKPAAYTPEQKGVVVHAEVLQEIEQVQGMLRDFRTVFGENPVGTNAEIMAALNGANARQARLGPPDGQGLNEKGELVDRWGTPYFFHQIDARHMEVHSAGADKVMGTADDVVMR